jgi:hypothetical protein
VGFEWMSGESRIGTSYGYKNQYYDRKKNQLVGISRTGMFGLAYALKTMQRMNLRGEGRHEED